MDRDFNVHDLASDSDFWAEVDQDEDTGHLEDEPSRPTRGGLAKQCLTKCHVCGRSLASLEGYKKHLKMHRVGELILTKPGAEVFGKECYEASDSILKAIADVDEVHPIAVDTKLIASKMLELPIEECRFFTDIIQEVLSIFSNVSASTLPGLDSHVKSNVHSLLCDMGKRAQFLSTLTSSVPVNFTKSAGDWFVAEVIRKVAATMEVLYFRSMKESLEWRLFEGKSAATLRDDPDDITFQSTIYYIGGSTVRSVMNYGLRAKNSDSWKLIVECLRKKFLVGDLVSAPLSDVVSWTESQSRGGLNFIGEPVWCFFMALSGVLSVSEGPDGSLPHEKVLNIVKDDDVLLLLWKDVVGDFLSVKEDEMLLTKICESFTNTWGSGVALRRKNAIVNLSRDKNALRSSLLTRQ